MKLPLITIISILTIISACNEKAPSNAPNKKYVQVTIKENNVTPTVNIEDFKLITNNVESERADAIEIMKVKRNWPLAMQRKDKKLFEIILAKNFAYRTANEFFNRDDYIKNRVEGKWTIDTVKYENLALQFFGDIALLTYRNILNGSDDNGKANIEHYSWANVFIKENGQWKVLASHNVDARVEYVTK